MKISSKESCSVTVLEPSKTLVIPAFFQSVTTILWPSEVVKPQLDETVLRGLVVVKR